MRQWIMVAVLALAVGQPGCGIIDSHIKADAEAWRLAVEERLADRASLSVAACAFALVEGRWPETPFEFDLGAAMIAPEIPERDFDFTRFRDIVLAEGPDRTIAISWRRAGGDWEHARVGPFEPCPTCGYYFGAPPTRCSDCGTAVSRLPAAGKSTRPGD